MHHEKIEYHHNGTVLEGYLAYDEQQAGRRPMILVGHAWAGRGDFAMKQANRLAELGYAAFAWDLYGKGVLGTNDAENTALMTPFMKDRHLLHDRVLAALNAAKNHPVTDPHHIGAIGFCFGGLCALDLARSGADVKAVVSFHGLLNPPQLHQHKILSKILVLHGYDDPMVPPADLLNFAEEMTAAGVDWQIHAYGHTKHAFTNPEAKISESGMLYNAKASQRSWQAMVNFFAETLK